MSVTSSGGKVDDGFSLEPSIHDGFSLEPFIHDGFSLEPTIYDGFSLETSIHDGFLLEPSMCSTSVTRLTVSMLKLETNWARRCSHEPTEVGSCGRRN